MGNKWYAGHCVPNTLPRAMHTAGATHFRSGPLVWLAVVTGRLRGREEGSRALTTKAVFWHRWQSGWGFISERAEDTSHKLGRATHQALCRAFYLTRSPLSLCERQPLGSSQILHLSSERDVTCPRPHGRSTVGFEPTWGWSQSPRSTTLTPELDRVPTVPLAGREQYSHPWPLASACPVLATIASWNQVGRQGWKVRRVRVGGRGT